MDAGEFKVGSRVKVLAHDTLHDLGNGTFEGVVTCYGVKVDHTLFTNVKPEEDVSEEAVIELGGEKVVMKEIPKFKFDDGRVFYGCQVFWRPVDVPAADDGVRNVMMRQLASELGADPDNAEAVVC